MYSNRYSVQRKTTIFTLHYPALSQEKRIADYQHITCETLVLLSIVQKGGDTPQYKACPLNEQRVFVTKKVQVVKPALLLLSEKC